MSESRYAHVHDLPGLPDTHHHLLHVSFDWNDVAIVAMLSALKEHYPAGYKSMREHVRAAIAAAETVAGTGGDSDA